MQSFLVRSAGSVAPNRVETEQNLVNNSVAPGLGSKPAEGVSKSSETIQQIHRRNRDSHLVESGRGHRQFDHSGGGFLSLCQGVVVAD